MNIILTVCLVAAAFIIGVVLTYVINKTLLASRAKTIIEEAEKEAEVLTKNKLLEVKEEFLQRKAELEKQVNSRNSKLQSAEAKLKQREMQLNQQQGELQRRKNEADVARANYEKQLEAVEKREQELEKLHKAEVEHLEKISGLSAEEAKERLVNSLIDEAKTQAASYINDRQPRGQTHHHTKHTACSGRDGDRKCRDSIPHRVGRDKGTYHRSRRSQYTCSRSCYRCGDNRG